MMHEALKDGAWFARRRLGFGIGMPITWQGWLLLTAYLTALAGIKLLDHAGWAGGRPLAFALFLPLTAIFLVVAGKRTRRKSAPVRSEADAAPSPSSEDTLFLCTRRGWKINCQPCGRAGWFALAAWTLPLLPMSLCLAWLLLRLPEHAAVIGIAFSLIVLIWCAGMALWIVSRSETVDS